MFVRKLIIAACVALLLPATVSFAQTSATQTAPAVTTTTDVPPGGMPVFVRPETPQQRKDRLGIPEDPGINPDPNQHYWRFGHSQHIERFERKWAAYDQPEGFVRPMAMVNIAFEVYQQNNQYVWAWIADREPVAPQAEMNEVQRASRYNQATLDFLKKERPQYAALAPTASDKVVHFREASSGLPNRGSWRNSLAVADMNEDGCPDIIAPPERKGNGMPAIFLGDCKGGWKAWTTATFPHALDYGSVAAADFNKDGHMDLAFAVHLSGVYVFLGDGKGNFREVTSGLPHDFATRRVAIADLDHDGYPDLIVPNEGPTQSTNPMSGSVLGFLNRDKGMSWQQVEIAPRPEKVGGDWVSTGDFNGDRYPDVVVASMYYGSTGVVRMSNGPKKWEPLFSDGDLLPSLSYYLASTTVKFTHGKRDDAVISYVRYWPSDVDPRLVPQPDLLEVTNVDLLTFSGNGIAKRTPIARWPGHGGVSGMASGDFDGDGNLDFVVLRDEPRELDIFLGDGHGGFRTAKLDGLTIDPNRTYDVKVADVNRDGRPDVILMYETSTTTVFTEKDGAIRVFLNTGTSKEATASPAQ
jgi:FG-GAP-like repeat/FG-GAP repeat